MRSSHADYFNHDQDAYGYDEDVRNTADPIRAGYDAVLDWVAEHSSISKRSRVLELGSGTGNLTVRLPDCQEIICVDVSQKMEALAHGKVSHFSNRRFIKDDVLAVFDRHIGPFDAVLSTYTLHHLTEDEKRYLFKHLWGVLNDGGVAIIGDLMVENQKELKNKIKDYRSQGIHDVAEALEEEFFWLLEQSVLALQNIGFLVEWKRFSDLSFGILAKKISEPKKA